MEDKVIIIYLNTYGDNGPSSIYYVRDPNVIERFLNKYPSNIYHTNIWSDESDLNILLPHDSDFNENKKF